MHAMTSEWYSNTYMNSITVIIGLNSHGIVTPSTFEKLRQAILQSIEAETNKTVGSVKINGLLYRKAMRDSNSSHAN